MSKTLFIASLITVLGMSGLAYGAVDAGKDVASADIPIPSGQDIGQTVDLLKQIVAGFKDGSYREAIAALITLLVFLWRRFFNNFVMAKIQDTFWVAIIAAGLGFLSTLAVQLVVGDFSWAKFLLEGFVTSAEALALWTLVGKKLLPKIFGKLVEPTTPV
jgi:hypothetical protein